MNDFIIAPSILSADFSDLSSEIAKIEEIDNSWVHIDVMDGHFVPNLTFGACVVSSLRKITNKFFDAHLMVDDPESLIEGFHRVGVNSITFHIEETHFPLRLIKKIRSYGMKVGVSLNPVTPFDVLVRILPYVDLLLIMSVEPGFSGQSFIPFSFEKIKRAVEVREKENLDFLISVDGGINEKTARAVLNAGADVLVMGSFFFKNEFNLVKSFIKSLKEREV